MKYEEFTVGQSFRSADYFVSDDEMYSFAKMYDPQAMHLDRPFAQASSFGNIIGSGFMSLALGWKLWIECGNQDIHGKGGIAMSDCQWHNPLYPNTTVHAMTNVAALRISSRGLGIISFDIQLLDDGDTLLTTFHVIGIVEREAGGSPATKG